jgi:hypothetical protein
MKEGSHRRGGKAIEPALPASRAPAASEDAWACLTADAQVGPKPGVLVRAAAPSSVVRHPAVCAQTAG